MSDKLRKILNRFGDEWLGSPKSYLTLIAKTIRKINRLHKSERKKWAISRKPEGQNTLDLYKSQEFRKGYNQALADYVKSIEEG